MWLSLPCVWAQEGTCRVPAGTLSSRVLSLLSGYRPVVGFVV